MEKYYNIRILWSQPHTQALFSMLLAEGRDPGECWSHASQILEATNDSCGGRWVVLSLVIVCNSSLLQLMTSVTRVTFTPTTFESSPP